MPQQNLFATLTQVPLFQSLSKPTLQAIERSTYLYPLQRGQTLFHIGDMAQSFYVVLEGGVRLVEESEGRSVHLKIYGKYDTFGLLAISGGYPYPHRCEAVEQSIVACFKGEDSRRLMLSHPDFALVLLDELVHHVHEAHARLRQMFTERVEQRLSRALLHYADKFGSPLENNAISIDVVLSQQALADFLGTTLETVNRILKQWEKNGWIRVSRQHIDILEADALKIQQAP